MMLGSRVIARRVVAVALTSSLALALAGAVHAANPATLSINCTPKAASPGIASSCVATVTGHGSGSFFPGSADRERELHVGRRRHVRPGDTCALDPAGAFSSKCTLAYSPTAISGRLASPACDVQRRREGHGRCDLGVHAGCDAYERRPRQCDAVADPREAVGHEPGRHVLGQRPSALQRRLRTGLVLAEAVTEERLAVRLTVGGRVDSVVAVFRRIARSSLASDAGCPTCRVLPAFPSMPHAARHLVAVAAPWTAVAGSSRSSRSSCLL